MLHWAVLEVVRTVIRHRAWAVLLILTMSLSIALPSAVATHEVPGPEPPVDPHQELPLPDLPVGTPEIGGGAGDLTEGWGSCTDTVLATFLDAITGMDPLSWFYPEEPYCKEQGDRIEGTVQGLEDQAQGTIPDLSP